MELESDTYDVVVLGTGLAESIAAASLAKIGKSVLHLDPNEYYASDQASLTLDELVSWAEQRNSTGVTGDSGESTYIKGQRRRYTRCSTSALNPSLERDRRRYALSLYPALLPSKGPLITTLVNSGVSKYVGFRLLDSVSLFDHGEMRKAPGSKEEVFKDKGISLVDKRRLMKFLMSVSGDFEDDKLLQGKHDIPILSFLEDTFVLPRDLATQIVFAISHCSSPYEPTLEVLKRTRRYLQSIGKYGNGAFLIAQYGGAGEIAQGFCRACAVKGGTYILGPQGRPTSIAVVGDSDGETPKIRISLPAHPTPITASHLIASSDHLSPDLAVGRSGSSAAAGGSNGTTAHCIAILPSLPSSLRRRRSATSASASSVQDSPQESEEQEEESEEDDTAVIIFPPSPPPSSEAPSRGSIGGERGVVRAVLMGEGTGSCPPGQYILYLASGTSGEADPEELLRPYLTTLHPEPLFTAFYLSHGAAPPGREGLDTRGPVHILQPYAESHTLTEGLDWEAEQGEAAFWAVLGLAPGDAPEGHRFFEREERDEEVDEDLG